MSLKTVGTGLFKGLSTISLLALIVSSMHPVHASKSKSNLEPVSPMSNNPDKPRFATIPTSVKDIVIVSENANVIVKRMPGVSEISASSNCPRNWNVQNGFIRQCGFSSQKKGTALLADALGSRAVVNGQVYIFQAGPMKGLQLGSQGVFINGQKIDPLKGSDIPCSCSGDDLLELRIPESFSGNLKLGAAGKSTLQVDNWKGGTFECTLMGDSSLSTGKLENLSKAVVDNLGRGKAEILDIETKILVANITGSGEIAVKGGKADISNATVSGQGKLALNGKFKNLQKMSEGQGTIEVNP